MIRKGEDPWRNIIAENVLGRKLVRPAKHTEGKMRIVLKCPGKQILQEENGQL